MLMLDLISSTNESACRVLIFALLVILPANVSAEESWQVWVDKVPLAGHVEHLELFDPTNDHLEAVATSHDSLRGVRIRITEGYSSGRLDLNPLLALPTLTDVRVNAWSSAGAPALLEVADIAQVLGHPSLERIEFTGTLARGDEAPALSVASPALRELTCHSDLLSAIVAGGGPGLRGLERLTIVAGGTWTILSRNYSLFSGDDFPNLRYLDVSTPSAGRVPPGVGLELTLQNLFGDAGSFPKLSTLRLPKNYIVEAGKNFDNSESDWKWLGQLEHLRELAFGSAANGHYDGLSLIADSLEKLEVLQCCHPARLVATVALASNLTSFGVTSDSRFEKPPPISLRDIQRLPQLESLSVKRVAVRENELRELVTRGTQLRTLALTYVVVGDATRAQAAKDDAISAIEHLTIVRVQGLSTVMLETLLSSSLRTLYVNMPDADGLLPLLQESYRLESLSLFGPGEPTGELTSPDWQALEGLTELRSLAIGGHPRDAEQIPLTLARRITSLTLVLHGDVEEVVHFTELKHLRVILLGHSVDRANQVFQWAQRLDKLESLSLSGRRYERTDEIRSYASQLIRRSVRVPVPFYYTN
jgi:hypothetical protein